MKNYSKALKITFAVMLAFIFVTACVPRTPYTPYTPEDGTRQRAGQTIGRAEARDRSVTITNTDNRLENGGIIWADYFPQDRRPIFSLRTPVRGIVVVRNRVWFEHNVAEGVHFTVVARNGDAVSEKTFVTHIPPVTGITLEWVTPEGSAVRNFDDLMVRVRPARHLVNFRLREEIQGMFVETIDQSFARAVYSTHVPAGTEFTVVAEISGTSISIERTFVAVDGGKFEDDFSGGLQGFMDNWHIGNGAWGQQIENGGVIPSNVMLTEDGYVALAANGDFYAGETMGFGSQRGIRSGATLISRNIFGPGAFEVEAKFMPRIGACSAIWTFYFDGNDTNHEIDFEAPGRHPHSGENSLENILYTSWRDDHTNYSTMYDTLPTPLNDGNWHTYRFEWRTSPQPEIRFYVNDQYRYTISDPRVVPNIAKRFWIGVWFPYAWCGVPRFERDYMFVRAVRHTPFMDQTGWEMGIHDSYAHIPAALPSQFPTEIVPTPVANLVSNAGFENSNEPIFVAPPVPNADTGPSWALSGANGNIAEIVDDVSHSGNKSLRIANTDDGETRARAVQYICAVYRDFTLDFSAMVKVVSGQAEIILEYLNYAGAQILATPVSVIVPANTEFTRLHRIAAEAPEGTKQVRIILTARDNSEVFFDDLQLRLAAPLTIPYPPSDPELFPGPGLHL